MILALLLLAIVLTLFFSGFFSGAETGLYCVDRVRLRLGVQQQHPRAQRLARLMEDEQKVLSVTLLGTNLMNYLLTAAVTFLLASHLGLGERQAEIYTVVLVTPVVFVFGEAVPKNLFHAHADALMLRGGRLLALACRFFSLTGVVWILKQLARGVFSVLGVPTETEEAFGPKRQMALLLREALVGDESGYEQSELVERVVSLSHTQLHQIMVPRNHVTSISADADRTRLQALARRTPHTRLPVYDRNPRRIIGLVRVDVLLRAPDWKAVGEKVSPLLTLAPHEDVVTALTRMQEGGHAMALVADRSGRLLGIITLKDLMEEVVGELEDW